MEPSFPKHHKLSVCTTRKSSLLRYQRCKHRGISDTQTHSRSPCNQHVGVLLCLCSLTLCVSVCQACLTGLYVSLNSKRRDSLQANPRCMCVPLEHQHVPSPFPNLRPHRLLSLNNLDTALSSANTAPHVCTKDCAPVQYYADATTEHLVRPPEREHTASLPKAVTLDC